MKSNEIKIEKKKETKSGRAMNGEQIKRDEI